MLVNVAGALLIGFIVWWFWFAKQKAKTGAQYDVIDIIAADGVYAPSFIRIAKGQTLTLRFTRKDPSPCAEKVVFSGLDKSVDLPLGEPREITLMVDKPGSYEFTCQMGMYRGKLLVQ